MNDHIVQTPGVPSNDPPRYFIDRDSSMHWYLVEAAHRAEWEAWLALDEDDEASWDAPHFAERIDHPNEITFANPEEE